jgi:DmsE family decaheme c-type cytochrome
MAALLVNALWAHPAAAVEQAKPATATEANSGAAVQAKPAAAAQAKSEVGVKAVQAAIAQAKLDPNAPATYVGEKVCTDCHDVEKGAFGHTQHANIFHLNPRSALEKTVCEACHGAGSKHVANTKDRSALIGFSREWGTPIEKQNEQCLTCHSGGQRMHWPNSIHETNKLGCSDCHNPMARFSANGLMKKASITETCQSCHPQQRAEFRKKSHMPVPEGKMTCEDCHNPHGSTTKRLLKADTVNDLCYTCHAEKRGPFLWEHAPVRENCMNCHAPHGSNQDKLLSQTRPMLCQQCHSGSGNMGHQLFAASTNSSLMQNPAAGRIVTVTGGSPSATQNVQLGASIRPEGRSCQGCHSQIHGSNSPNGARFQR